MSQSNTRATRGELWWIDFNPTRGYEIQKTRPALVVGIDAVGGPGMKIVVPLTSYQERHDGYAWCVPIKPNQRNGLGKKSTADASQIKCLSTDRFVNRIGVVSSAALDDVVAAVALCIDF